jgi:hypothetical protein
MAQIQLFRDTNFLGASIIKTESDANLKDDGFTGGPNSDGRYPNTQSLAGRGDSISSLKKNSDNPL